MNIAVFASGSGSNLQQIIDRQKSGELPVKISLFVGNNSKAPCFERAQEAAIPTLHISQSHFKTEEIYTEKLLTALKDAAVELIILAGYMKMLPPALIAAYPFKIINVHPALLPSFGGEGMYGIHVHRAVKEHGCRISGITIHFVDEEYDRGAIIHQESVPVFETDSAEDIAERVLNCEHNIYWQVIKAIAQKSIYVKNGRVCGIFKR